jgi:hypothetical protein
MELAITWRRFMLRSYHRLVCTIAALICGSVPIAGDAQVSLTDHATGKAVPRYTTLDIFGSHVFPVVSINDRRMVTGTYSPIDAPLTGFALLDRFLHPIDFADWQSVILLGNNDRGEIVGLLSRSDREIGFRYSRGAITSISVPASLSTTPRDINDRGDIVGVTTLLMDFRTHGFLLSGDQFTLIEGPEGATGLNVFGINDRREVVGSYEPAGTLFVTIGFLFRDGTYTTLRAPEATRTFPFAINNRGQIVGSYSDAASTEHGFLLWKGRYVTIDIPNSNQTRITSINDFGDIVGTYLDTVFVRRAFKSNIREFIPRLSVQR